MTTDTTAAAPAISVSIPNSGAKSILFVIKSGEYGGAEKHLVELVRRFADSGVDVSVLCLDKDFYTARLCGTPGLQIKVWSDSGLNSFLAWYRVLRTKRPDTVVFVRAWLWCFPWYAPLAAWFAGVKRRISIAQMTAPAAPPRVMGWSPRAIIRRLKRARHLLSLRVSAVFHDCMICVSDAIRTPLINDYGFSAARTVTVYNGVSLVEFGPSQANRAAIRRSLGLLADEFVYVCAARLSEQKRIDVLLNAMVKVVEAGVRCKCVLVGDGPLREELMRQAQYLQLTGHVLFVGFHHDVRPYLQAADAFVLTSYREGLPLSIVEAMACGLPCVVTDVGGNAEAVHHSVHGLVVPSGAVDEIAATMCYLVRHPEERARMAEHALARANQAFETEALMGRIKSVLLA